MKSSSAISYSTFALAFAYFVVFNILDLSSTILALRLGLSEANFAILYLSSTLGISIAKVVLIVKSIFFVSVGGALIYGLGTKSQTVKKAILLTIVIFGALFAIVSISNFLSIYSVISR